MNSVSTKTVQPSENILKLRALVNKLDKDEIAIIDEHCRKAIEDLKELIVSERNRIAAASTLESKLKNYDLLIMKITLLLNEVKLK
jgi:phage terminase Nu1 subunit (DNA packaging protein)